jgi:hypothetical protein
VLRTRVAQLFRHRKNADARADGLEKLLVDWVPKQELSRLTRSNALLKRKFATLLANSGQAQLEASQTRVLEVAKQRLVFEVAQLTNEKELALQQASRLQQILDAAIVSSKENKDAGPESAQLLNAQMRRN